MRKMKSLCIRRRRDVEKNEQEKQGDYVENEVVDGKGKKEDNEEGEENDEGKKRMMRKMRLVTMCIRISVKLHVHVLT